jgi:hypothetical protein
MPGQKSNIGVLITRQSIKIKMAETCVRICMCMYRKDFTLLTGSTALSFTAAGVPLACEAHTNFAQ